MSQNTLHNAVKLGDESVILSLLQSGNYDVNEVDDKLYTPLFVAVKENNTSVAKLLLDNGASVHIQEQFLLQIAIAFNNLPMLKLLVEHGTYIDKKLNIIYLYFAVTQGRYEIAKYLLATGIDANRLFMEFSTPLYQIMNIHMYELLILYKVNLNITDKYLKTPLYYAIQHQDNKLISLLLENGADINIKYEYSDSLLHVAAWATCNSDTIRILISHGADINARNWVNMTPLHIFVIQVNIEAVKVLLEYGADVNVIDDSKKTPLEYAVYNSRYEITELLLSYGANPNLRNSVKATPLFQAIKTNNVKIVECLLSYGASTDITDTYNDTPLVIASDLNNVDILRLLLIHGANPNSLDARGRTVLYSAVLFGKIQFVKTLIEHGADIHHVDPNNDTVLCPYFIEKRVAIELISRMVTSETYREASIHSYGFFINSRIIDRNERLSAIKKKCVDEIAKIKHIKLNKSISADMFLRKDISINVLCKVSNHALLKGIGKKFSIYGSFVCRRKREARKRRIKLNDGLKAIKNVYQFSLIPVEIRNYILELLDDSSITSLVTASTLSI